MNITFDPRNPDDRSLVLAVLGHLEIPSVASEPAAPADDKPRRTRRTKEQIAADEAAAKQQAAGPGPVDAIAEKPAGSSVLISKEAATAGVAAHTDPPAETKTVGEMLAKAQGTEPAAPPAAAVPTKEEVIAKFQALVAKFGKDVATEKARKIINDLGAANISGIPEEKRAEAMAKADAELAESNPGVGI